MTEEMKNAVLRHQLYHTLYSALHNLRMAGKKQGTGIASNTPTPTASLSPYHPDYGLTNDTRIRAVRIAETSGVKAAAAECNVAVSTVYKWIRVYATSVINT